MVVIDGSPLATEGLKAVEPAFLSACFTSRLVYPLGAAVFR